MKIALVQLNYHIGNFHSNRERIIEHINKAKLEGSDLVVFSELSVCGYHPYDLLERQEFNNWTQESIEIITNACADIAVIIGAPTINESNRGKKLFNSAIFIENQKIQKIVHKTLLTTYDIFDEYRHFEQNNLFEIIEFKGKKIALTICEDLWDDQPINNTFGKTKIYHTAPLEELSKQNPDLVINIAASPFSYNQEDTRKEVLVRNAKRYSLPIIYVNQVGAQTEVVFDGGSLYMNPNGEVEQELAYFSEDFRIIDVNNLPTKSIQPEYSTIEKYTKHLLLEFATILEK